MSDAHLTILDRFLSGADLLGPRLSALVAYQKGACHMSYATITTFLTTGGVAPTNNLTEQAIRFVVIDRKVTQGTRGSVGQRWCERVWTLLATCAQQGRSAFAFLADSLAAHFCRQPPPSLLPANL